MPQQKTPGKKMIPATLQAHSGAPGKAICEVCQKEFQQSRYWQLVCSKKCRAEKKRREWHQFVEWRKKMASQGAS